MTKEWLGRGGEVRRRGGGGAGLVARDVRSAARGVGGARAVRGDAGGREWAPESDRGVDDSDLVGATYRRQRAASGARSRRRRAVARSGERAGAAGAGGCDSERAAADASRIAQAALRISACGGGGP